MMAYISHTLVVQCMNDECVRFRSCWRAAFAPIVSEQDGTAMDLYFVIFCVNCFVYRINLSAKNQGVSSKRYTYYISNVSFL